MKIYENLDINNLDGEFWKDVLDYESDYQVSNIGRIKSLKFGKERILRQNEDNHKYFYIELCKSGKRKNKKIHILIFETFNNYKLKDDECIHHIDENRKNNNLNNFKLMTESEHKSFHKRSKETRNKMSESHKGENNNMSLLTNKKIIQIKMLLRLGFKNVEISNIYKIDSSTISKIKTEKTWSHIKV